MTNKVTLTTVSNPQNLTSLETTINANSAVIETAFNNTLSRDGSQPNQMMNSLDMNSNQIINLPAPSTANSPARLQDVVSNPTIVIPGTGTSGHVVPFLDGNNTWSGTNTYSSTTTLNGSTVVNGSVTLPANCVTNSNLATMPSLTVKGNVTGGAATPTDVTMPQLRTNLGVLSTTTTTKTANYTALTSDIGSTFILGGGNFTSFTFGAASGYPGNFAVNLINLDTRGKSIVPTGSTTFILWPGQTVTIYNANSNWVWNNPGRWTLPVGSTTTFYVDPVNGNDSNDGLATGTSALRTIQAGVDLICNELDIQGGSIVLQCADGLYTSTVHLYTPTGWRTIGGHAELAIRGNLTTPSNCLMSTGNAGCFATVMCYIPWKIEGFKMTCTGANNCLGADGCSRLYFSQCDFGSCGNAHLSSSYGSFLEAVGPYTISGGAAYHANSFSQSQCDLANWTVTLTGTPAFGTFSGAFGGSINNHEAAIYSGAATGTRYVATSNSVIDVAGAGATFLPGNAVGSVSTGGQYL